jgi:hypothetical protein
MQSAEGLRRHFAKYQQHERQNRRARGQHEFAAQAQRNESNQHRCRNVDNRAEQQNQSDEPVRVSEEFLGKPRAAISFVGAVPEAIAVQAHERRFAAGKKGREDEQTRQRAEQGS